MDPNANLEEARSLVQWLEEHQDEESTEDLSTEAYRLAELFGSLDEWICKGGFLPQDWRKK